MKSRTKINRRNIMKGGNTYTLSSISNYEINGVKYPQAIVLRLLKGNGPIKWLEKYEHGDDAKKRYAKYDDLDEDANTFKLTYYGKDSGKGNLLNKIATKSLANKLKNNSFEETLTVDELNALAFSVMGNLGPYDEYKKIKKQGLSFLSQNDGLNGHICWAFANEWALNSDTITKKMIEKLKAYLIEQPSTSLDIDHETYPIYLKQSFNNTEKLGLLVKAYESVETEVMGGNEKTLKDNIQTDIDTFELFKAN